MIKNYKIRLKGFGDADLIWLKECVGRRFQSYITLAVKSYVRNKDYIFITPTQEKKGMIDLREKQMFIRLDEEKDKDVIKWMDNIENRFRNITIKNVFRHCLDKPVIEAFITGE